MNSSFVKYFVQKLSVYRTEKGLRPIWLDIELERQPLMFVNSDKFCKVVHYLEHETVQPFDNQPVFLDDQPTHIAINMIQNHNGACLKIVLLKRPIAIDYVYRQNELEIGILVLDNTFSVCGLKAYCEEQQYCYGPDQIQTKNNQDLKINIKICEYVEVYCVRKEEIRYGQRGTRTIPINGEMVYAFSGQVQLDSIINYLTKQINDKRLGKSNMFASCSKFQVKLKNTVGSLFGETKFTESQQEEQNQKSYKVQKMRLKENIQPNSEQSSNYREIDCFYQKLSTPSYPDDIFDDPERMRQLLKVSLLNQLNHVKSLCQFAHLSPFVKIESAGQMYSMSRVLLTKYSSISKYNQILEQLTVNPYSSHCFYWFSKCLEQPSFATFQSISPKIAMEMLKLLQQLQFFNEQPSFRTILCSVCLLPQLDQQIFTRLLSLDFHHELMLTYYKKHSHEMPIDTIPEQYVEQSLDNCQDVNHLMDQLCLLTDNKNVIDILQEHTLDKPFSKITYNVPKIEGSLAVLVQNYSIVTKFVCESHGLEKTKYDMGYEYKMKKLSKGLVILPQFQYRSRKWQILLEYDGCDAFLMVKFVGHCRREKMKKNYCSLTVQFDCQIGRQMFQQEIFCSFSMESQTFGVKLGCVSTPSETNIKIYLKKNAIHQSCLHYLSLRWHELMKWTEVSMHRRSIEMGQRRSSVLLEEGLKVGSSIWRQGHSETEKEEIFSISEFNMYYLFNSSNLEIRNESLLLLNLAKYYLANHDLTGFALSAIKYHLVPLSTMLCIGFQHPVLRNNPIYQQLLEKELEYRYGYDKRPSFVKDRKHSKPLQSDGIDKQVINWLQSEHFKKFKAKMALRAHRQE